MHISALSLLSALVVYAATLVGVSVAQPLPFMAKADAADKEKAFVKPDYIRRLPSRRHMQELCKEARESRVCGIYAIRGRCVGRSGLARVLRSKRCPCTCAAYTQIRAQACCYDYIKNPEYGQCADLCRYNITKTELMSPELSTKCFHYTSKIVYCLWDDNPQVDCCVKRGVPSECAAMFCGKKQISCSPRIMLKMRYCVEHYDKIQSCQMESLAKKPQWTTDSPNAECAPDDV